MTLDLNLNHTIFCMSVLDVLLKKNKKPWDSFCIYYKACKGKAKALDRLKSKRFIDKTTTMSSLKRRVLCAPYAVLTPSLLESTVVSVACCEHGTKNKPESDPERQRSLVEGSSVPKGQQNRNSEPTQNWRGFRCRLLKVLGGPCQTSEMKPKKEICGMP